MHRQAYSMSSKPWVRRWHIIVFCWGVMFPLNLITEIVWAWQEAKDETRHAINSFAIMRKGGDNG